MLLVGEGLAEQNLLRHLGRLYLQRGSKAASYKSAHGKGGQAVLDYAIRQHRATPYDQVLVLLDSDAAWNDTQRQKAKKHGIQVIESHPCIEALLLRCLGQVAPSNSPGCKRAFKAALNAEAHDEQVLTKHLPKLTLDRARATVAELDAMIRAIQT